MSAAFWLGTSWKMNKLLGDAERFCDTVRDAEVLRDPRLQPFVIPPFTAVLPVRRSLADTPVRVGAQTMHWADSGAWTGEISAPMLRDCGLDLVELGHSERRTHFNETDAQVGLKVGAALRHGLIPLICVGETDAEKRAGKADAVLERQVRTALAGAGTLSPTLPLLLAYEPVWAIGEHGTPASADYAEARHRHSLAVARDQCPGRVIRCLYGGSVNEGNCAELAACPHVDGLFIGRAAWAADGFLRIAARVQAVLPPG